jgi:hypothetical protein
VFGPLAQVKRSRHTPAEYRPTSDRVTSGACILDLLPGLVTVKKTLKTYYGNSQLIVIPWVTLSNATDAIIKTLKDDYPTKAQRLVLVEKIFTNTEKPLEIEESITAETFHRSFTGANLRWEILGILFTSIALGLKATEGDTSQEAIEREKLNKELVHASNVCISFCDRAESLNDLFLWL